MDGLRERKKARVRKGILEAAERLFDDQGFHGTRVSDIAAAVEIGEATLYRYFPSKDELLRCLHRDLVRRLSRPTSSAPSDASVVERLCFLTGSFFERYADYARQHPWLEGVTHAIRAQPQQRDACEGVQDETPLCRMIREGQRCGEIDRTLDARLLAETLRGMLLSCFTHEDMKSHCETAIRVFLGGVRAPARRSAPRAD